MMNYKMRLSTLTRSLRWTVMTIVLSFLFVNSTFAESQPKRTELQRTEVPGNPDIVVIVSLLEMPPGSYLGAHSHHGVEMVVIVDGGTAKTNAGESVQFTPGMTIKFPQNTVHGGFTVTGNTTIRAVLTQVVEKGKPLVVPEEKESDDLAMNPTTIPTQAGIRPSAS